MVGLLLCFTSQPYRLRAEPAVEDGAGAARSGDGASRAADPGPVGGTPLSFEWSAPASCPSQQRVRRQVERHLRRSLTDVQTPVAGVVAEVRVVEAGYLLSIRTLTPDGERSRELEHEDCLSLANAASVIIAIALDPTAVEHLADDLPEGPAGSTSAPPADVPATEPSSRSAPAVQPTRPSTSAHSQSQPPPASWHVAVAAAGQRGPLPEIGPGFELAIGLDAVGFWAQAYGTYWLANDAEFPELDTALVRVGLWTAGLRAGPSVEWSGLSWVPLSAGFEMGLMNAAPSGLAAQRSSTTLWAAASAQSVVRLSLTRTLGLLVQGEGLLTLARRKYMVNDFGLIHLPKRYGGRFVLGMTWTL